MPRLMRKWDIGDYTIFLCNTLLSYKGGSDLLEVENPGRYQLDQLSRLTCPVVGQDSGPSSWWYLYSNV